MTNPEHHLPVMATDQDILNFARQILITCRMDDFGTTQDNRILGWARASNIAWMGSLDDEEARGLAGLWRLADKWWWVSRQDGTAIHDAEIWQLCSNELRAALAAIEAAQ